MNKKEVEGIEKVIKEYSSNGKVNGERYYSFPDVKTLGTITEEAFREMKTGFRAPYLYDAAQKLATGVISVETLKGLNENETRDELISIKGVGEKVANCVMLFSLGFREAFPVDGVEYENYSDSEEEEEDDE